LPTLDLSAGRIEYEDTRGRGPVVLLLHGLLMDSTLWQEVMTDLRHDHRCIVPTLPLGAHRIPTSSDLSLELVTGLVVELMDALDIDDVTVVGNDTGGVIVQLLAAANSPRLGRIVLVSCDAFENFPPGLTGKALVLSGKLSPRLFGLFMQQMRLKFIRRLPIAFGWLTKRGDALARSWLGPVLGQPGIRQDVVTLLRSIAAQPSLLTDMAPKFPEFERPALIVWASEDRVMPPDHGRRLAQAFPRARLIEIPDSYTLVPLDQPGALAESIREFIASSEIEQAPAEALGKPAVGQTRAQG
jgi:pimeloyl-ACP methyl ester carboxylesterase